MRWTGHAIHMGRMRNACNILVGKPGRQRPLRMPRGRWEIILEMMLLKEGGKVWTGVIYLRVGTI